MKKNAFSIVQKLGKTKTVEERIQLIASFVGGDTKAVEKMAAAAVTAQEDAAIKKAFEEELRNCKYDLHLDAAKAAFVGAAAGFLEGMRRLHPPGKLLAEAGAAGAIAGISAEVVGTPEYINCVKSAEKDFVTRMDAYKAAQDAKARASTTYQHDCHQGRSNPDINPYPWRQATPTGYGSAFANPGGFGIGGGIRF